MIDKDLLNTNLRTGRKTVLANRIAVYCSCNRVAEYSLKGEYYCKNCFEKLKKTLFEDKVDVIFPTHAKSKDYPKLKSSFLVRTGTRKTRGFSKGRGGKRGVGRKRKRKLTQEEAILTLFK